MRVRLSQTELERLSSTGFTEDRVRFSPGAELLYRVCVEPEGPVRAEYDRDRVSVLLPQAAFERWLEPEEVSIRGEQPVGGAETLKILVEKDFACLAPRAEEDDSDLFPNPTKSPR